MKFTRYQAEQIAKLAIIDGRKNACIDPSILAPLIVDDYIINDIKETVNRKDADNLKNSH